MTYSILPVLKMKDAVGNFKSITISDSIKITRFTSCKLLTKKIVYSILDALLNYNIQDSDIDLFIMGRPWLRAEDFNVKLSEVTEILDNQIEKEISSINLNKFLDNIINFK